MSEQETLSRDTVLVKIDRIEPNKWNTNEVRGDKYTQLVKDMSEEGQREPITVSPKGIFYGLEDYAPTEENLEYVLCDGEHRYKAAKSLGWSEIRAIIRYLTEDEATTEFYRQQSTRGDNNPLKEAEMFEYYFKEKKLKEHQIATKFNVTKDYVTNRRRLLRVSPKVQELYLDPTAFLVEASAPVEALSPSHLKAMVGLDDDDQTRLAMESILNGKSSKWVEEQAKAIKAEKAKQKRFMKAWETAKRKNCPECDLPPRGFYGTDEIMFYCTAIQPHTWRFDLTEEEEKARQEEVMRQQAEDFKQRVYEDIEKIIENYRLIGISKGPTMPQLQHDLHMKVVSLTTDETTELIEQYLKENPDVTLRTQQDVYFKGISDLIDADPNITIVELIRGIQDNWMLEARSASNIIDQYLAEHPEVELDEGVTLSRDTNPEIIVPEGTEAPENPAQTFNPKAFTDNLAKDAGVPDEVDEEDETAAEPDIREALGESSAETVVLPQYKVQRIGRVVSALELAIHHLTKDKLDEIFFSKIRQLELITKQIRERYDVERNARDEQDKQDLEVQPEEEAKEVPDTPTIPVPDHGREYQEDGGTVLCANCEKQVPEAIMCMYCGEKLLPGEPEPEQDSELVTKWLDSPIKELRGLRDQLTPEDIETLKERDTRKGAQALLDKAQTSIPEAIPAEDD